MDEFLCTHGYTRNMISFVNYFVKEMKRTWSPICRKVCLEKYLQRKVPEQWLVTKRKKHRKLAVCQWDVCDHENCLYKVFHVVSCSSCRKRYCLLSMAAEEKKHYLPRPFSQSVNSMEWTARSTPYGPISVLVQNGGRREGEKRGREERKISASQS